MPQAAEHPTYPSRRSALRISVTATTAALLAPLASATASSPDADAELIRLCGALTRVRGDHDALVRCATTIAEEEAQEPELKRLGKQEYRLMAAIIALCPPQTMAGARAVSSAAMAVHYRGRDGGLNVEDCYPAEALALLVAEALATGTVA